MISRADTTPGPGGLRGGWSTQRLGPQSIRNPDEPLFDGDPAPDGPDPGPVHERVHALVEGQPYTVLCVQGEGQPYGAPVKELDLDLARSQMAVVVQEMVEADRSGVALSRDPRSPGPERAIVESVAGPRRRLPVDGEVDPDRWELDRGSHRVLGSRAGQRTDGGKVAPLLEERCLFDADERVGAAGDWCGGPHVEGAFLSGAVLARQFLERT